ncbi:MAG: glutamate 5-kinase [Micavibrio aeruginosavorus]|uniref:Glutamate 5-kinase n=1 Tax=Micavibrio aeruginosavorus TaxID=349221 RepID=A0A2W5MU70_9BACT|nr:MAG: glutamate 5-kinase [Micavibrio aeruginosavorus]
MIPKDLIAASKTIIIKIGSALLVDADNGARIPWLNALSDDVMVLKKAGKSILIVTSGSIALGRKAMGVSHTERPSSIPLELKQAAAAVGQIALMECYIKAFSSYGQAVAQILLTPSDTENRSSHLNARATIHALLGKGIIPVVNENDTVSTAEIRFGDNDRLASRVAQMIGADLVIQLSTTDGLYTADPRVDSLAQHIPLVERLTQEHIAMAGDALAGVSTGGMKSKIEAARIATESGVHMMIAKGTDHHALSNVCNGEARATIFLASGQPRSARQKWILAHVKPKGGLILDAGACQALLAGKSLLPAGVKSIEGAFERGDAVKIYDSNGKMLGVGLCAYDGESTRQIAGRKSAEIHQILGYSRGDELIHRDDLVLNS